MNKSTRGFLFIASGLLAGHYLFKPLTPQQKIFALTGAMATGLPAVVSKQIKHYNKGEEE